MGKDLNSCNFIGRLGRDPEIKYTAGGTAIASFSIACGDDYKDAQGSKVEQTNWINCTAFGNLAEIVGQYVKKGSRVYLSGKQQTDEWEKDGIKRYSTKINVRDLQMLDSRGAAGDPSGNPGGSQGAEGGQSSAQAATNQSANAYKEQSQGDAQPGGFDDFGDSKIPFLTER